MKAREDIASALSWIETNLRRDPSAVRAMIDRFMPLAESMAFEDEQAWLKFFRGWLAIDGCRFEEAMAILKETRSQFEATGNMEGRVRVANALGAVYDELGVIDMALEHFRDSAGMAERMGRKELAGVAAMNMAESLYLLGEYETSLRVIHQCRNELAVLRPSSRFFIHYTAGRVLHALGRTLEAESELQEALAHAGDRLSDHVNAQRHLAELFVDTGRLDEAATEIARALAACAKAGLQIHQARLRLTRAKLAQAKGQHESSLADLAFVLETAQERSARPLEAEAELAAYHAWQACGEHAKALAAYLRHTEIKDSMRGDVKAHRMTTLHNEQAHREARYFEGLYRHLSVLGEIGRRITSNLDLDALLGDIYEAINGIMSAPVLRIGFLDEARECLVFRLVVDHGERLDSARSPKGEDTLEWQCVETGQERVVCDFCQEYPERAMASGPSALSWVLVPLTVADRVEGVISVQHPGRGVYGRQEVETVRAIGAYVAVAMENARLFQQVQVLASTDTLTGLMNRKCIADVVAKDFRKVVRYRSKASLIAVDIDRFKAVNDRFGHEAGDRVIQAVAGVLQGAIRRCDSAGRFGGEEFLVFLPETSPEGAVVLADRLRTSVEALGVHMPDGTLLQVTISLGVSAFRASDSSWEQAVNRADMALYRSKREGRNRVSVQG